MISVRDVGLLVKWMLLLRGVVGEESGVVLAEEQSGLYPCGTVSYTGPL